MNRRRILKMIDKKTTKTTKNTKTTKTKKPAVKKAVVKKSVKKQTKKTVKAVINKVEKTEKEKVIKKEPTWDDYVYSEIGKLLDSLVPISKGGSIGLSYKSKVLEHTEAGIVYDKKKAEGVQLIIDLDFSEPIEKPE